MAAVQQRSPAESLTPTSPKDTNFIANMEDEVRRCAEHLERRQSLRKGFRSLERKANGYSTGSGSYFDAAGSSSARRDGAISKGKTLPRSFTVSSDPMPEERSLLSPRLIPPGGKSPGQKKSPERSVFKFSSGGDSSAFSRPQQVREETDRPPAGYHRGNSAPPDASPFYSASSGSCSRDSSVTPLQSPLGRTPIGAVASHSRSRRSSYSSSPPPPAVPPKCGSTSPPAVPPKPSNSRSRRAKSNLPSPSRSNKQHKVTVTSIRRNSLTLSPPPPMDPDLVSKLSAEDSEDNPKRERIEFPSAEVDLKTFHDRVLRAKSLLQASTGESVNSYGMESSVDVEDYGGTKQSAPPPFCRGAHGVGTAVGAEVLAAGTSSGEEFPADSIHRTSKLGSLNTGTVQARPTQSRPEASVRITATESSVDVDDRSEGGKSLAHTGTTASDLSLDNQISSPSISDPSISDRGSAMSMEEPSGIGCAEKEGKAAAAGRTGAELKGAVGKESEDEQKDDLLNELSEKTCLTPTNVPASFQVPSVNIVESNHSQGSQKSPNEEDTDDAANSVDIRILSSGMGSDDYTDEVFSMPSPVQPGTSASVDEGNEASDQLEVKSIPARSLKVASKHQGSHPPRQNTKNSEDSTVTLESSEPRPASTSVDPDEGLPELEGMSEAVTLLIKQLRIELREKEEDLGRLQRQKDKEVKERDEKVKKLAREAKKVEREKWELLKRARDAAERSLHLRTQLDMKQGALRSAQGELDRTRDELVSVKSANTSLRALLGDLRASRPSVDVGVQADINTGTLRRNRSIELALTQGELSQENERGGFDSTTDVRASSSSLGLHWPEHWDPGRASADSHSLQDLVQENYQPLGSRESRRSRKKGALLSKMMRSSGRRGSRSSITSMEGFDLSPSKTSLTSIGSHHQSVAASDLKEHWRILEEAKGTPFLQWGLKVLVAWMEAELGMGQYSRAMADKFPTPSSLLALSDAEMEKKLGMSNALHRRKLTLALQDKKAPELSLFPQASKIDHSWVAFEWAHDCGLAHLTEVITTHLIDGRVLNTLNKDDLKKYLKINKKVDQMSFLSGVELLRMHDFNREAIQEHRKNCRNPLYWTNRDVADWLHHIDLQDYANNVIGGGVHGALLFLERGRFTSDHLSSIIQIPTSKSQLRRHLTGKMASLFSEDFGSNDALPASSIFSHSPVDSSGSQSPPRGSRTPGPSWLSSPSDLHPARRNSLGRKAAQQHLTKSLLTASPPSLKRVGSSPLSVKNSVPPPHFQRSQLDSVEGVRNSLRESALRSISREEPPPPRSNGTATPTILSSTTV